MLLSHCAVSAGGSHLGNKTLAVPADTSTPIPPEDMDQQDRLSQDYLGLFVYFSSQSLSIREKKVQVLVYCRGS